MNRKLICLIILVLVPAAGAQTLVDFFSDDFETPHDYVADNVADTGWDGYFGWLPGETVDALNASMDPNHPGQLYLASTNAVWADPWDPLGPFLYKYVEGDFIATVQVTGYADIGEWGDDQWLLNNDVGLMARASKADPNDEADTGEDWVSIDYFPIWNCGNFHWNADNDVRYELGHNGKEFNADPWLQLERSGNVIHVRTSPDGVTWTEMATSPVTRDDFEGLPLQVGIRQANYTFSNAGVYSWAAVDNFSIVLVRRFKAYNPVPGDEAVNVDPNQDLSWSPGNKAEFHDVYFGSNFDDVNNADTSTAEIYKGRQSETSYEPGTLALGETYYWRIDEVNEADGDSPWKSPVWSFTVMATHATAPGPSDGAVCVPIDIGRLTWTLGVSMQFQDIYFGTTSPPPRVKMNHNLSYYTLPDLEYDTTYYWKVDTKKLTPPPMGNWPGEEWSFTTVPSMSIIDANLVGWWKFDEVCSDSTTVIDSSGYGHHGTLIGNLQYTEGFENDALEFDGRDDYVDLPIGSVIGSLTNSTFAIWLDSQPGGQWARAFDFNNDQNAYMCLGPRWWFMDDMYFALTTDGAANQSLVQPTGFDIETGWHHIAVTINANASITTLYYDGEELARNSTLTPSDLGETTNNWLGRSHDANDAYYLGSMDDFRIYDYALSQAEIDRVMKGDPLLAWNPSPANGSTPDEARLSPLTWSPGDNAAQHDVYIGTDPNAVELADASDTSGIYRGRQDPNSYTLPEDPEWGRTYYWRIDEYNNDETISKGRIWNFTVADYLIVEDFESFNDIEEGQEGSNLIYLTWIDGYVEPPAVPTNGSTMGYVVAYQPTMEFAIVHGGFQSAPFAYNNTTASYSEITVSTSDLAVGRDWTKDDVQVLTLWFYGDPNNAVTEQLYAKLNGVKINYDGDAANLATAGWTQWNIDLSAFGINLANVTELSIGLERIGNSSGSGLLLIDDIRLYIEAPSTDGIGGLANL